MARGNIVLFRVDNQELELLEQLEGELQEKNPKLKNRSKLLRYLIQKEASQLGVNVQRPYVQASATD